jgi:hypothetical protein
MSRGVRPSRGAAPPKPASRSVSHSYATAGICILLDGSGTLGVLNVSIEDEDRTIQQSDGRAPRGDASELWTLLGGETGAPSTRGSRLSGSLGVLHERQRATPGL